MRLSVCSMSKALSSERLAASSSSVAWAWRLRRARRISVDSRSVGVAGETGLGWRVSWDESVDGSGSASS